jgi:hypothetical protein
MPTASVAPSPLVAARDAAVVCDLSPLAVLAIDGPDATAFLQGQLSSDVSGLGADACQYSSYNSPAGRMLANFVLWPEGTDADAGFRALVAADIAAAIAKRLAMFVLRSKVRVTDISANFARHGVGGPDAAAAVRAAIGAAPAPFAVLRDGETTVLSLPGPRFVLLAPFGKEEGIVAALAGGEAPAPFAVWQWLTITAGVPVITAVTQDKFVAQALNWDVLGGVNFRKGCYPGQEIVARTQYLGRLKERLYAFRAPAGAVAPGDRLYSAVFDEQACGTVVNAAPAPDGDTDLLAVVQLAAIASGDVRLGTPSGPSLRPLSLPYAVPAAIAPPARAAGSRAGP